MRSSPFTAGIVTIAAIVVTATPVCALEMHMAASKEEFKAVYDVSTAGWHALTPEAGEHVGSPVAMPTRLTP